MIIPNIWKTKNCSKPPTRIYIYICTHMMVYVDRLYVQYRCIFGLVNHDYSPVTTQPGRMWITIEQPRLLFNVGPRFMKSLNWCVYNSNFTMVYDTQKTSYNYSSRGLWTNLWRSFTGVLFKFWSYMIIEGSLEVKLPTIWRDEKQSRAEAERRGRLAERRSEEKESEERRCRCAKR